MDLAIFQPNGNMAFDLNGTLVVCKVGQVLTLPECPIIQYDIADNDRAALLSSPGDEYRTDVRIASYAYFGDSFAAEMGTGETSGDGCRVGSNNYGDLLYQWIGDYIIPYEHMACSRGTLSGLHQQINEWRQSVIKSGGNDLSFSELVKMCMLAPETGTGQTSALNRIDMILPRRVARCASKKYHHCQLTIHPSSPGLHTDLFEIQMPGMIAGAKDGRSEGNATIQHTGWPRAEVLSHVPTNIQLKVKTDVALALYEHYPHGEDQRDGKRGSRVCMNCRTISWRYIFSGHAEKLCGY